MRNSEEKVTLTTRRERVGFFIALIQMVSTIIFLFALRRLGFIPFSYIVAIGIIPIIFALVSLFLYTIPRKKEMSKALDVAVKVFSVLLAMALSVGTLYAFMLNDALNAPVRPDRVVITDDIVVLVRKDDPVQEIYEATGYSFGVVLDSPDLEEILEKLGERLDDNFSVVYFEFVTDSAYALIHEEIDAMLYNANFLDSLDEIFEDFFYFVRVLYTIVIDTVIYFPPIDDEEAPTPINIDPFVLFISGIDSNGGINTVSRSDTNILLVINPQTAQILMVSTPRDFWVEFPAVGEFPGRHRDKLNHAGAIRRGNTRGIDISMATMGQIYGIEIDHYVRLTIPSFMNIVDALGGVDVYSERAFTALGVTPVVRGMNRFNGTQAMHFVRERGSFADGDFQRGRNNMALVEGVMRQMLDPRFLMNPIAVNNVINILPTAIETSFSRDDINFMMNHQLSNRTSWNMQNAQAMGTPGREPINPNNPNITTSVIHPNQTSVNEIRAQIQAVLNGEILTDGSLVE